ncbi:LPS export ABC transporter periplasmic protein LptC [Candidatus Atelocyanobacterium thalassae]|uniref:Lipopolysaccharide export system protein LptC n=1 Tax=cyanobacterium endosymbiont of Braarudosphaera bigelowii TaxID=1285375 RepID=A0ABN6K086_9CHRO|nr:LPS export ABC transporter periplasmic protein LptC [Candidatus Atelocyanobacterium thalassa]BDA40155.1 lipopolysaccharide export system protein LptC [cyanobacterium endosymbiont of Braarudosphaera bigelowii]
MDQKYRNRQQHSLKLKLIRKGMLLLLLSLLACQVEDKTNTNTKTLEKVKEETNLNLQNATLEQSDADGKLLWKIQVDEAKYSPDREKATLTAVKGNIFENGTLVLQIKADYGEIHGNGTKIFLRNNVLAIDPRNQAVIRSEEIEWQPRESLLTMRKNLRGFHPQLEISANEGKYYTHKQKLELKGKIEAISEHKKIKMNTEHLFWEIEKQMVTSNKLSNIVRFEGDTITANLIAQKIVIHLNKHHILVRDNIEYKSIQPPLQASANAILWNYQTRQIFSDQPVQLVQYEENITLIGNKAHVDLSNNIAYLKGKVQGINNNNKSVLQANNLTWYIIDQNIEAIGSVFYLQEENPKFTLAGDKAVGSLKENTIVVTNSNREERVVTEFFTNSK